MNDAHKNLLSNLILIGQEDSHLASILGERKKLEAEIQSKKNEVQRLEREAFTALKLLNEKKEFYRRDEKKLKEERDKLSDRRKALTTLSNYKLQQAAEREIDHSSAELNTHEETLIDVLGQLDTLEADSKKKNEVLDASRKAFLDLETEAKEAFVRLEERQKKHSDERSRLAQAMDKAALSSYDRIRERHPMNPVVPVKNKDSCSGCFMQVGPQMVVQILKGDSVVRCRGCGRILYIKDGEEE